jgi:ankyrin repeat protein
LLCYIKDKVLFNLKNGALMFAKKFLILFMVLLPGTIWAMENEDLLPAAQIDICTLIDKAYAAQKYNVVRDLARKCCCMAKRSFSSSADGANAQSSDALNILTSTHSIFLPSDSVEMYSLKNKHLKKVTSFGPSGKDWLDALNAGDIQAALENSALGDYSLDSILLISNPLTNQNENASILQYAVRLKNPELIEQLASAGADINFGSGLAIGTPLHTATFNLDETIVKLLLEKGANVNAKDANGVTPLHIIATLSGSPVALSITQQLLDAGARTDALTQSGQTILNLLPENENKNEVQKLLLSHITPVKQEEIADLQKVDPWAISTDQPLHIMDVYHPNSNRNTNRYEEDNAQPEMLMNTNY